MNARATAIIATRLIGLLMFIWGAAQLLGQIVPLLQFMRWLNWDVTIVWENLSGGGRFGLSANLAALGLVSLIVGWYLLFRGRRVHGWLLAGLGSECGKCGYSLHGVTGGKCPECGEGIVRLNENRES